MKPVIATIEQPVSLAAAPPSPSLIPGAEWGLWGAIGFLAVRELLKWFHNKEDSETKLLHSLIESLQSNQAQLLKQLVETQHNTNQAINGLKSAVEALGQQIRMETAQIARSNHQAIREIHNRLDKIDGRKSDEDLDDEPTAIRGKR